MPVGIVALVMVLTFLHLPKFGDRGKPRIDWWGAMLVIVTLVPLLLIAEQGREWGWDSPGAIACYAIGALGLIAFVIVERSMGDDAILPLKLFGSRVFSMAAVLSVLVGFGMFARDADHPAVPADREGRDPDGVRLRHAPDGPRPDDRVDRLRPDHLAHRQVPGVPVTGTAFTAIGFTVLTFLTADRPLWFLMLGMFGIGWASGSSCRR